MRSGRKLTNIKVRKAPSGCTEGHGKEEKTMGKHPIDHGRNGDDAKAAEEYARIEREHAEPITDPKVKAMTKAAHRDEERTASTRLKKFVEIERLKPEE